MASELNDYERKILDNIDEHGWFCTSVFDPNGDEPSFAYSIGFSRTFGGPEFIVFGLGAELMHSMLWDTFRQLQDGKQAEDESCWSGLLDGFDCISRSVHPSNIVQDWFNSAMWFWSDIERRTGLPAAMQLVWPSSKSGRFPWEPDCEQDVRDLQPTLWLPNRSLH